MGRSFSARLAVIVVLAIMMGLSLLQRVTVLKSRLKLQWPLAYLPPGSSWNTVLEHLVPDPVLPNRGQQYRIVTQKGIRTVVQCLVEYGSSCKDRPEGKVVILEYPHFRSTTSGSTTGEVIWCESVLVAMETLGYTVLTANNQDEVIQQYSMFPDLVRVVIMQVRWGQDLQSNHIRNCFLNDTCILSDHNASGIAPWKIFGLTFWGTRGDPVELHHPYGPSRVLAPYKFPDHFWLGYAIDHHCTLNPVIPTEGRKAQALILAKKYSYFYNQNDVAFGPETWKPLSEETGMELISVASDDLGGNGALPEGVTGIGKLTREEFYRELGLSQALIGNGLPILSPSPLDALCIGVPFIHPYLEDQPLHPEGWDRFRMKFYQHGPLLDIGPPSVYHVKKGDVAGLIGALKAAKENPINGRALPEEYTMASLMERVRLLVESDWEGRARREGYIQ